MNKIIYDFDKSISDNLDECTVKYMIMEVERDNMKVVDIENVPSEYSKIITNPSVVERHAQAFETILFLPDYYVPIGTHVRKFTKLYNPNFKCDERVFLDAILVRYVSNHHKPFNYSVTQMEREIGVGKDRRKTILKKFEDKGIIKLKQVPSDYSKHSITNISVFPKKLIELVPEIFSEQWTSHDEIQSQLDEYLKAGYFSEPTIV